MTHVLLLLLAADVLWKGLHAERMRPEAHQAAARLGAKAPPGHQAAVVRKAPEDPEFDPADAEEDSLAGVRGKRSRWLRTAAFATLLLGEGAESFPSGADVHQYAYLRPARSHVLRYDGASSPIVQAASSQVLAASQGSDVAEDFGSLPKSWRERLARDMTQMFRSSRGAVYKCRLKDSGHEVLVKVLYVDDSSTGLASEREIFALETFRGGDFVTMFDVEQVASPDGTSKVLILMEAATCDLAEFLAARSSSLTAEVKIRLAVELLRGLATMAEAGYSHGDVKPRNILVVGNSSSPDGCHLKLTDFGCSSTTQFVGEVPLPHGSRYFMAPEVWRQRSLIGKSDVWSAGIVLYNLFLGRLPEAFYHESLRPPEDAENLEDDPLAEYLSRQFNILNDDGFAQLEREDAAVARLIGMMLIRPVWARLDIRRALRRAQEIAASRGIEVPEQPEQEPPRGWFG